MNPQDKTVVTWQWDRPTATTDEVQLLIEALGYDPKQVFYMMGDDEPMVSSAEVSDRLPDFQPRRILPTATLTTASQMAAIDICDTLFNFVKQYGEEPTDYDINEFGLDCDQEEGCEITRVLNLFDNGGAYFAVQRQPNDDDVKEDDIDAQMDTFEHYAFQCLYIVRDSDGDESLKYYAFENGGLVWDDDLSEPDHDSIHTLRLDVLEQLLQAIIKENKE